MTEYLKFSSDLLVRTASLLGPITQTFEQFITGRLDDRSFKYVPAYTGFFIQSFVLFALLWRKFAGVSDVRKIPFITACSVSMLHCVIILSAGYLELQPWFTEKKFDLDMPNTPIQCLQLQFSLAYMIVDTLSTFAFEPLNFSTILFHAHHVLAGLYLYTVLYLQKGAISCIFVFFMGEVTSIAFNTFNISKTLRHDSPVCNDIFKFISPIFTFSFVAVRSVISVPLILFFLYKLYFDTAGIALVPWKLIMGSTVILGMIGSQIWSYKLVKGYKKHVSTTSLKDKVAYSKPGPRKRR